MLVSVSALSVAWLAAAVQGAVCAAPAKASIVRPNIKAWPLNPGNLHLNSPARSADKVCYVKPSCVGKDDAAAILKAFQQCNNGGTVVLDRNYTIASPLDLTFLNAIDVAITGTINFSDNMTSWADHMFKYAYQDSLAMWRFGGKDVNIYGQGVGVMNGNGQVWWDAFAANSALLRPILFVVDGLHGGSVTGLNMRNPPDWFNLIANSSNIIVSDLDLKVKSISKHIAKNTDGWDTYRSDSIVIQNSVINNGDDCVSFKPNSTNIVVQGLQCNGSHGISVGSLGQYIDEFDIVENIYVYNISMANASDGARIKVWPGMYTPFQPTLSGGGGSGYVKNVTYDGLFNTNNDWAIELTQCYGQKNLTLCNEYPSNMIIQDVVFKNMWGTTSKSHDPNVGTLVCSAPGLCKNIRAQNITVTPPSGKPAKFICTNLDNSLLDIACS
ncbi:exopolygalacturonase X like protein [Verticillium longisporum]|uniref:galacturonan 1,4-alpha-galacturonidase n=1 Tax=Verticillium longisporum TaxID=100787 RepID=A0A0G4MZX8_VERLO|nr:exopolygalacturonase X like protein [Verticillium longisporum]KAG7127675.1 exopolygalacturonase X like protein [Verticillium longisporum]CRK39620.1 hypothetical protein BN1708_016732 [Verticillium longisporum]